MMEANDPIVIMGAGSIGERHIGILQKLGFNNLWVYRQRNLPLREIVPDSIFTFTELHAIEHINPKAAIVCTPTAQHLQQALFCTERKIPVLIEKPLSHNLVDLEKLAVLAAGKNSLVRVAYMLRYHPFFQKIQRFIFADTFGKILSMQSYWGEYLPDWHPWEDYRQSYAAKKAYGGGAALTLSHDLDLLNWLSQSKVSTWYMQKNYRATLEIDVESGADVSISYQNGITAHSHVNFYEQSGKRFYRFVFEKASVEVDYYQSSMNIFEKETITTETAHDFTRNQLYESQLLDFFKQIGTGEFQELTRQTLDESKMIITICQ